MCWPHRCTIVTTLVALLGTLTVTAAAGVDDSETAQPPTPIRGFLACERTVEHPGQRRPAVVDLPGPADLIRRETRDRYEQATLHDISDPRLAGTWTARGNMDEYVHPGLETTDDWAVASVVVRLENAEGAWQGQGHDVLLPGVPQPDVALMVMAGEGAYDGLTALIATSWSDDPCGSEIRGLIYEGEPPPMPEVEALD